ncbi:MAG: hypothetical protein IMY67_11200 [Bacteroidetes bacterium]|nr:hypothetical protein [Bacteroidota bacterium]
MNHKSEYKTGLEWVSNMPNGNTRAKAKKNLTEVTKIKKYPCLSKVIEVGFIWFHSPEGYAFWDSVHKRIVKQENKK